MSRKYTEQDFHGGMYTQYRRYPFFATRAEIIDDLFRADYRNEIVVVAGCGWGYLIDELSNRQWNRVYGLDISEYAVFDAAERELPTRASRVLYGDVLNPDDLQGFRSDVGRPWFVVTEDLLPCADNIGEAQQMLDNLRDFRRPPGDIMHFITPKLEDTNQVGHLWLSEQEWLDVIGPGEPVVFAGSNEAVNV